MPSISYYKKVTFIVSMAASLCFGLIGFAQTQQSLDCSFEHMPAEMQAYLKKMSQSNREQMKQNCLDLNKQLEMERKNPDSDYAKRLYNDNVLAKVREIWAGAHLNDEAVQISFEITPPGNLNNLKIHKTSGKPDVDQAALNAFLSARFEPYQSQVDQSRKFLARSLYKTGTIIPIRVPDEMNLLAGEIEYSTNASLKKTPFSFSEKFFSTALLKVNQNGQIQDVALHRSSGNKYVDDMLLEALKKSGPFLPYLSNNQEPLDFYVLTVGYMLEGRPDVKKPIVEIKNVERLDSDGLLTSSTSTDLAHWVKRNLNFYLLDALITQDPSSKVAYDFTVLPNGQLNNIQLHQASTDKAFNEKALSILRLAAPFKPYTPKSGDGLQEFRFYLEPRKHRVYRMTFPHSNELADVNGYNGCCGRSDYEPTVLDLLHEVWAPPRYTQASPVYIMFRLDPNGNLTALNLDSPSGVAELDAYTLQTIKSLAPFPRYGATNKPFVEFSFAMHTLGMEGESSWKRPDMLRKYLTFKGQYLGEVKPDTAAYINLDIKGTKPNTAYANAKIQIQNVLKQQWEMTHRKREFPPEIMANPVLRSRAQALLKDMSIGPGNVTVRFTVAPDGHPVAIHTLNVVGNHPGREQSLEMSTEAAIAAAGPYQLPPQHYEITLKYP